MSSPTNWSACIFCNKKSYKQDKKLLKIESDERVSRITNAANHNGDSNLLHKISQDNFKEQAFYHNQCITKYLKYLKKNIEVIGNSTSECESINAAAFSKLISSINDDLLRNKKAFLLSTLIEKFVSYLPENMPTSFTTRKLQRYLENHYDDSVVIQSQQGQERIKRGIERSLAIDDTTASLTDAIPYLKPKCRSEPPRRSDAFDKLQLWDYNKSDDVDQIWVFSRLLSRDVIEFPIEIKVNEQKIPFWTGYNCLLSKKGVDVTVVAYPPIIDSNPNDMATVYTAMKKCLDMSNDAGQDYAIQTFDQQLYAIAQQVKWSKPDIFNRHILRLGGFHSLSCFLASIGKLWADGGLRDLLVDSGVYAGNTAELMLNGKEFYRAVRGFTLVNEALQVLFISAFIHWCRTFDYFDQIPSAFWNVLLEFHTSICDQTDQASDIKTRLEKLFEDHVQPLIGMFKEWGHDTSPTFKYWDMFLVAVQIMLSIVRAEREGNWSAHLMSSSKMLPYFYFTNRTNYSRWMPVYILDMLELPAEIESAFKLGEFSIRQKQSTFNGIWSDMGTKKTIIKDSGGIVGITN
ncbi:unnamed protein product [Mytilus coruscus]|uniref:Uncharacterized protein n=1 Tax=Mytilus coruscus TaxID=42192 RepID=A0A6J8EIK9_MYTCO|nr:unnamed protein product [Mytilus coruscus]